MTCGHIEDDGTQNICKLSSPWQDVGQCCIILCLSPPCMRSSELNRTAAGSRLSKAPGLLIPAWVLRAAWEMLGEWWDFCSSGALICISNLIYFCMCMFEMHAIVDSRSGRGMREKLNICNNVIQTVTYLSIWKTTPVFNNKTDKIWWSVGPAWKRVDLDWT